VIHYSYLEMSNEYSRDRTERLRNWAATDTSIEFPKNKLQQGSSSQKLIAFVACGSFNPITYMHLRLFEQAKDHAQTLNLSVVGGYFSPVSDAYKKQGLQPANHRIKMCELATESSDWIMVDKWESSQKEYQTTILILDHMRASLNREKKENEPKVEVKLLCGGDLLESMNKPGVWAPEDIADIVSSYGIFVLERAGSDLNEIINASEVLSKYKANIHIIKQTIANDISSTKVRQSIASGLSIKYLTSESVVKYIKDNKLYS